MFENPVYDLGNVTAQKTTDLITFTEEIFYRKLQVLCSAS